MIAPHLHDGITMVSITDIPSESEADSISPYVCATSRKLHDAADRALNYYLNPVPVKAQIIPGSIFTIAPDINNETLLAHASESLESARVMAGDFVGVLEGSHRKTMLALQQIIMLGQLAVNRVLDNTGVSENA